MYLGHVFHVSVGRAFTSLAKMRCRKVMLVKASVVKLLQWLWATGIPVHHEPGSLNEDEVKCDGG